MSAPNYPILSVSEADLPTIAGFVRASKLQLAINRFLIKDWPNDAVQLAQSTNAVQSSFKDPLVTFAKAVDEKSGDIVGHLVLTRRKGGAAEAPAGHEDESQNTPPGLEHEVLSTVTKMIKDLDKEWIGIDHIREDESAPCNSETC